MSVMVRQRFFFVRVLFGLIVTVATLSGCTGAEESSDSASRGMGVPQARAVLRDLPAAPTIPSAVSKPKERTLFIQEFCEAFGRFARRHAEYHRSHGENVHDLEFAEISGEFVGSLRDLPAPPGDGAFVDAIVKRFELGHRTVEIGAAVLEGTDNQAVAERITDRGLAIENPAGRALTRYGVKFSTVAGQGCR